MIYIGIDVAKDKHDLFITNSDGEVLFKVFLSQTTCMVLMSFIKILDLLRKMLQK